MTWQQVRKPKTSIPVRPGWCLAYVQDAFDAPWAGATATDGWNRAKHKHQGGSFPEGVSVPVWFAMSGVSAGHVVIRMSDGSVYSTSSPSSNRAVHHKSLGALYSYYGSGRLSLRGWSEDIGGVKVIQKKEEDDVYMGKTAKYYHDKLVKTQKELAKALGERKTYRDRLVKVLGIVTGIVKSRGK